MKRALVVVGEFEQQGAAGKTHGDQHPKDGSDAEDFRGHGLAPEGQLVVPYLAVAVTFAAKSWAVCKISAQGASLRS